MLPAKIMTYILHISFIHQISASNLLKRYFLNIASFLCFWFNARFRFLRETNSRSV